MQPELLRPPPPVGHQHPRKGLEAGPRPPMHEQLRIVDQLTAPLLQFVHEGILLVGIESLIEPPQIQHGLAPGEEIAENEFLLARLAHPANGGVASAAGPKRQPARQHPRKDLLQRRRLARADIRPAHHLHGRLAKLQRCAAQVPGLGNRIVVQEIDQIPARGSQADVTLDGRLPPASHDNLQPVGRVIQGVAGRNGQNLGLSRAGGAHYRAGQPGKLVAHRG